MKPASVVERKKRLDRRRLIVAVIGAIVLHLWLFYFTFPSFPEAPEPPGKKGPTVIKRWRPPPKDKPKPPPPPTERRIQKPTAIIPVPDPTPEEPEEIIPLEQEPDIEIPLDEDFVWGIPEAPETPESTEDTGETKVYNEYEVSQLPEVIKDVKPDYPDLARLAGVKAMVVVEFIVDENGDVRSVTLLHSTGGTFKEKFEQAAVKAASTFKFKPAIQAGHAVACKAKYTFWFRLD